MDDETNLTSEPDDDITEYDFNEYDDELGMTAADRLVDTIDSNIDHMLEVATVEAVYGAPIKQRDTLIIPAAEVSAYMGFGLGIGSGRTDEETGENDGEGGGGGGGFSLSRPVAVIVSAPDGVRVEPVVDVTKIAIAALTAGAFMFSMLGRVGQMRRKFKTLEKSLKG